MFEALNLAWQSGELRSMQAARDTQRAARPSCEAGRFVLWCVKCKLSKRFGAVPVIHLLSTKSAIRKPRAIRQWALALLAILVDLLLHWLLLQGQERVQGVLARPLGPCDMERFKNRGVVVLACPHTDLIKLWPLPVEQPWYEDPLYPFSVARSR